MEEKKVVHAGVTGFLLVIAIIAVAIEGMFIWKMNNEKKANVENTVSYQQELNKINKKNTELQDKLDKISEVVNSNNNSVKNTLSYDDMVNELISFVYGGNGNGPYEKVSREGSAFDGMSTRAFILDIDNNDIPEIIEFGSRPIGDIDFQVYTMNNNDVITLSHKANLLDNTFVIYETENGVYAYENHDDGNISDIIIYKLKLNGVELGVDEVLRHYIIKDTLSDEVKIVEEKFYVDGNIVDENVYKQKIDELNKIKIINKNFYRKLESVGGFIEYENLWN